MRCRSRDCIRSNNTVCARGEGENKILLYLFAYDILWYSAQYYQRIADIRIGEEINVVAKYYTMSRVGQWQLV